MNKSIHSERIFDQSNCSTLYRALFTSFSTSTLPSIIETIAKAAIAVGADGLFIETHPRPAEAKSDGANMLQLDKIESLLTKLVKIRKAINA